MLDYIVIEGYIYAKTGIRIGGNKDTMQIGGIDSPVIKNPINNMPYIPGSSLKGKIRFLLEHKYECFEERKIYKNNVITSKIGEVSGINTKSRVNNNNLNWEYNQIAVMFGHTNHEKIKANPSYPTRILFQDSNIVGVILDENDLTEKAIDRDIQGLKLKMGSDFSEAKMEVNIDRLTGTVNTASGGPRTLERVPAGTVFDFSVTLRSFRKKEFEEHKKLLLEGLKMLENDSLGGSGSRGYGRIKDIGLKIYDEHRKILEELSF